MIKNIIQYLKCGKAIFIIGLLSIFSILFGVIIMYFCENGISGILPLYIKILIFITSFIALVLSFLNILLSVRAIRNAAIMSANIRLCEYEYKIADNENLLRFHINDKPDDWLKKHGLTKEEFAYLVASFSISSALYNTSPEKQRLIQYGSYRDNMFKTQAMQEAWPAVKEMLGSQDFIEKMDMLYNLHKR